MSDKSFSPQRLLEAMNGRSNAELARELGCARASITMYLKGERVPSNMTLHLMALCLGVQPDWLMGRDVPKYAKAPTPDEGAEAIRPARQALLDAVNDLDDETAAAILDVIKSVKRLRGE